MPTVRPGRYQRPGIFVEEFDRSLFESPSVDGVVSLVLGVSKRGPVNTPITLNSQNDLQTFFGNLDRSLENRESYFHRTVSKLLESTPVVAINLFNPDDVLDRLDYKSMSLAVKHTNGTKKDASYRDFFDTSSFWKKDTESFLSITRDVAGDENRVFHLTNTGEKQVTVFMVKSNINGFDRNLMEWYGSMDAVPEYLSPKDFASDYLVDVVVLSGDWTNYQELSIDERFGQYFSTEGLIKEELQNMVNDQAVNLVRYWEGLSLIPFFRDRRGSNIFIETVINRETERTGVFCAYDTEAVEQNFRTGLVDLIGNSIVDPESKKRKDIDFLSYRADLEEQIEYGNTVLDRPGNTFILPIDTNNIIETGDREGLFGEGYVSGFSDALSGPTGTSAAPSLNITTMDAYGIIGGEVIEVEDDTYTFNFDNSDIPNVLLSGDVFHRAIVLRSDGVITSNPTTTNLLEDIVLGYIEFEVSGGEITSFDYINVACDNNGNFIPFSNVNSNLTGDTLTIEFPSLVGNIEPNDFINYRYLKHFNVIANTLNTSTATMLIDVTGTEKRSVGNFDITINNIPNQAREIIITGDNLSEVEQHGLVVYLVDDEFIFKPGSDAVTTLITKDTFPTSGSEGLVARYSRYYLDFFNGIIGSMDYFEDNGDNIYLANFIDAEVLTVWLVNSRESFLDDIAAPTASTMLEEITINSKKGNYKQSIEIEPHPNGDTLPDNKILINTLRYPEVRRGDFLWVKYESQNDGQPRKLTRILSRRTFDEELTEITCDAAIQKISIDGDLQTFRFTEIDDYVDTYRGINFGGFIKRDDSLPNGTEQRQQDIMNIINRGTPLFNAITDKDRFDFRYLVDSFGLGLTEQSKRQLVDITGKRKDAFGIINMPSMSQFRRNQSPTFVDSEGRLRTEFIRQGGDPESSPAFLYSLAEGDGATTVGYFGPWLTVNDAGRPKNVPPAAWIATTFLRKHNDSIPSVVPWTIAAGVRDGRITGIAGLEYEFVTEDIINLNQMSVNPIVNKRNRGFAIETENTAQVLANSSLSFIHVREVMIELERALVDMLAEFQWSFNTPEIRSEIKLRADAICEDFVNRNGLFNFFNKCDGENNTPDLIDQQIGVLDTFIEPIQGMAVIVNNITILRTGAIESGGFL